MQHPCNIMQQSMQQFVGRGVFQSRVAAFLENYGILSFPQKKTRPKRSPRPPANCCMDCCMDVAWMLHGGLTMKLRRPRPKGCQKGAKRGPRGSKEPRGQKRATRSHEQNWETEKRRVKCKKARKGPQCLQTAAVVRSVQAELWTAGRAT